MAKITCNGLQKSTISLGKVQVQVIGDDAEYKPIRRFQRTSILQQTGFLNREELHTADLEALQKNPNSNEIGFFKTGRWAWSHNPEQYASKNYAACLANVKDGTPFENTNLPAGHLYQEWSLSSEQKRIEAGILSNLKQNGDWGI